MEPSRLAVSIRARSPLPTRQHPVFVVIFNCRSAVFADVNCLVRLALRPLQLREFERLVLITVWAGNPEPPLVAVLECRFDATQSSDLRRGRQKGIIVGSSRYEELAKTS